MSEFNEPSKSGWATFHRVCGWFLFALGGIGFVLLLFLNASGGSEEGAAIQLLILGIAGGITSFFAAFLIDVFTDMRHFLAGMRKDLAEFGGEVEVAEGPPRILGVADAVKRAVSWHGAPTMRLPRVRTLA